MAFKYPSSWQEATLRITNGDRLATLSLDFEGRKFMIRKLENDLPPQLHEGLLIERFPGHNQGLGVAIVITGTPSTMGVEYTFLTADDEEFYSTPMIQSPRVK